MKTDISKSVIRQDAESKIGGTAKYIGDYKIDGMLYAKTLRSTEVRAKILDIRYPALPEGYYIVDKNDIPGKNRVKIVVYDEPFFAEDIVNYYGEPIALVVGPDKNIIEDILSEIKVEYEKLDPILEMNDDYKNPIYGENNKFSDYKFSKGDIEKAKENSKYVIEGEYSTGIQEQLYMEPQGVIGLYENGVATVIGSMQCPYYIKNAVEECLGFPPDRVRIVQAVTGGAFGGKEDFPSVTGGQVAAASIKTGKPVQLIFSRDEDLEVTTKRHPSKIRIKSYVSEDYKVLGSVIHIKLDAGAYAGLSSVVLQRAMFASLGVYNIENAEVFGEAIATNKVVSGAFRGFGAPQAFFAVEMHMAHIAKELGIDVLKFKKMNLLKKGDRTSTNGLFRDDILLPKMIDRAVEMSSYNEKIKEFKNNPGKGIGISLFFHGGGFTGSGERDFIKAKAKLRKNGNKVELLIANVEMGQGAQTTMRKIVSSALDIPLTDVIYQNPDTSRIVNSGPTVASRTIVIVGKLVNDAALQIKKRWKEDNFEVISNYIYPEGYSFDDKTFNGDAYTSYSWGVNVVEVTVDRVTYETKVDKVWAIFDIGRAIDDKIVKGQIDGGILQGLGYGGIEVMDIKDGRVLQRTNSDYTISTSKDAPLIISELINEPYENGPYGAKALGELTLVGAASAYALAVENALDININRIPVRPEHLMEVSKQ